MDKKLNRRILFDKSSQKTSEPASNPKPRIPAPKIDRGLQACEKLNLAASVVKWINCHEYFKWSSMCLKIGLDKGNFKRIKDSENPVIPAEQLIKIINIIKDYGYAE